MKTARPPEGAWYGRGPDRYVTRGAAVQHGPDGWYAIVAKKARGPLSCLPAAMEAADRMLDEARAQEAAA